MRLFAFKQYPLCASFSSNAKREIPILPAMRHAHSKEVSPLHQAGLKSTPGRRAVLQVLEKTSTPLTPEQIHARVGSSVCDRATVYRILESLGEADLVQRVILSGKTLYLPEQTNHHHHHVVCRKCRTAICLDECLVSSLEKKAKELGFSNIRHALQLTGICAKCAG